ncbi:MAG: group 1 truncated hemoglobin [Pseudohongiella sp.]|nr:group 1 truncated hemoglobin [Pseudohongiella sp.]MDO9519818.1 group 1 truncated hemoglobin [Pseudohongiella sp.]MDP2126216.1 group 1 truncated hemoglobin [Pseudohongiella sp.]
MSAKQGTLRAGMAIVLSLLVACANNGSSTLYEELGGQQTIVQLADHFVMEIAYDNRVLPRFMDSNVERFREKIIEHFCWIADGPCQYTGDSMVQVHAGMDINSAEFNAVVENLIAAMDKTGIALSAQNRLLERLAVLRPEIMGI